MDEQKPDPLEAFRAVPFNKYETFFDYLTFSDDELSTLITLRANESRANRELIAEYPKYVGRRDDPDHGPGHHKTTLTKNRAKVYLKGRTGYRDEIADIISEAISRELSDGRLGESVAVLLAQHVGMPPIDPSTAYQDLYQPDMSALSL